MAIAAFLYGQLQWRLLCILLKCVSDEMKTTITVELQICGMIDSTELVLVGSITFYA